MLDWIQDWESNKTTIGSTYILTPKIFVGKKVETAADLEALCGVYIGPDSPSDNSAGLYGYHLGETIFQLDKNGGVIGGWGLTTKYLYSSHVLLDTEHQYIGVGKAAIDSSANSSAMAAIWAETYNHPQSNALTSIKLNDKIQSFEVDGCPNLTTLTFEGYDAITSLKIGANVGSLNTKVFATGLYEAKVTNATSSTQAINTLRIKNVSWTGLNVSVLSWIADITNVDINGTISIDEPSLTQNAVTFELKNKFNIKWGNVDDETSAEHQGLKITEPNLGLERINGKITINK